MFAPEEANFATKASSTRVQTREVCAEPREHLGKRVHATVAGTQFDMFVYDGRRGIKDIVSDSIAGSGSWERSETENLMSLLPCNVDDAAGRDGAACGENARRRGTLLDVSARAKRSKTADATRCAIKVRKSRDDRGRSFVPFCARDAVARPPARQSQKNALIKRVRGHNLSTVSVRVVEAVRRRAHGFFDVLVERGAR